MSTPAAALAATVLPATATAPAPRLALGLLVGLVAASIGALYTVYARWGIARGLHPTDLTALRFGVAGLLTLPVVAAAWHRDRAALLARWRAWLAVAALAGTPFGLLMFGALQLAPPSHAAVLPFTAMSVMGLLLGAWLLGDRLTPRKLLGMAVVVAGLVLVSGVDGASFGLRSATGDLLFVAAGTAWAGFGIVLRRQRLDPMLATAVISLSALLTYVPVYLAWTGGARLLAVDPRVLWTEVLVQGAIAGAGTLYAYAKMVSMLGPARAAVFPALAPGLAALMAWPVLGHVPTAAETTGLAIVIAGLLLSVTPGRPR